MEQIQTGIYKENQNLYTINGSPGEKVYGEGLYEREGNEYRAWHAKRSKAAAAVKNNLTLGIEEKDEILYLGAASGTTVSHFSDIATKGFIYSVEYSETVARDLVRLAEKRENIAPILGDARNPGEYEDLIDGNVDVVFQDISQSDQAEIFLKNVEKYLREGGIGLFSIKAHSISTSRNEEEVFKQVKDKITRKFDIISETMLEPYEKNHLFIKLRFKGEKA